MYPQVVTFLTHDGQFVWRSQLRGYVDGKFVDEMLCQIVYYYYYGVVALYVAAERIEIIVTRLAEKSV